MQRRDRHRGILWPSLERFPDILMVSLLHGMRHQHALPEDLLAASAAPQCNLALAGSSSNNDGHRRDRPSPVNHHLSIELVEPHSPIEGAVEQPSQGDLPRFQNTSVTGWDGATPLRHMGWVGRSASDFASAEEPTSERASRLARGANQVEQSGRDRVIHDLHSKAFWPLCAGHHLVPKQSPLLSFLEQHSRRELSCRCSHVRGSA